MAKTESTTQSTPPGKSKRSKQQNATQTHMRVAEIRDNTVILKNGGIRAVLKTSSINFNLKSEEEQNSIIYSYQGFLNSLEFPIQILVRSKRLDIDDYIDQVRNIGEKQSNKLLQEQTFEYAQYVKRLVEYADIMEKEFFVIVPYDPPRAQSVSVFQSFFQRISPKDSYSEIKKRHKEFNEIKKTLSQRINVVKAGLENCGLKVEQLDTQALIKSFYEIYNPVVARSAKLKNLSGTTIESDEDKIKEEESETENQIEDQEI